MSNRVAIRLLVLPLIISTSILAAGARSGARGDAVTDSKIWVYLADHAEGSPAELAAVIEAAPVSERSLERRRKRGAGTIVDVHDLPVHAAYVERIKRTGCVLKRTSKYLNAVSVVATPQQLAQIRALPFVTRLEPVRRYKRSAPDVRFEESQGSSSSSPRHGAEAAPTSFDYGPSFAQIDQINVVPLHDAGYHGDSVLVAVFDTGFNRSHVALQHLDLLAEWDFIFDDANTRNEAGDVYNQDYHGTQVLSAMAGFAEGNLIGPAYAATFVLAKTERMFEEVVGEEDDFVRALEWVDSIGADVVSASLGYYDWYTFADMDGNTAITTVACDIAASKGITICTAAGNERNSAWGHIIAPSDGDSVIAVGAVDAAGNVASFSSAGPSFDGRIKPDLSARGVSTACVTPWDSLSYTTSNGTSLATPLLGGACALVLQLNDTWGPMDVRQALRDYASHSDTPNNDIGWGIIDTYQSALGGATGVVRDSFSLDAALSGNVVTITIYNSSSTAQTVDLVRTGIRQDGNVNQEQTKEFDDILVSGSSRFEMFDTLPGGGVYEYMLSLSDNPLDQLAGPTVNLPFGVSLGQNGSNPFVLGRDADTVIPYSVKGAPSTVGQDYPIGAYTDVRLEIYDVRGARVATLVDDIRPPGDYTARWDGRNDRGGTVASGVYFYRLEATGQVLTRKLVLIRR